MERIRPNIIHSIKNKFEEIRLNRETVPSRLLIGYLGQETTPPSGLSKKATEIWEKRKYGTWVAYVFRIYKLRESMPWMKNEEYALFSSHLSSELIRDEREKMLIKNHAKFPNSPLLSAYQEIVDLNQATKENHRKLVYNLYNSYASNNYKDLSPAIIAEFGVEIVNEAFFKIARGIKYADFREQDLETRKWFVEKAIKEQEHKILEVHEMLNIPH